MPASKSARYWGLLVLIVIGASVLGPAAAGNQPVVGSQLALTPVTGQNAALLWLAANQSSDGSYGAYHEHLAAAAAYALWLNNSNSPVASLTYSWLSAQLNSSNAWFWGTESDVPGTVLFSISSSANLDLVNRTLVASSLLAMQKSGSGFEGYYDLSLGQTVTSSVDTGLALLGLVNARAMSQTNETSATNYLLSLQNSDGSFNLTGSVRFDPYYSLGPDPMSITAVSVLALRSAGFSRNSPAVAKAIGYLETAISSSFGGAGHVYAAATAVLALLAYGQPSKTVAAVSYILSLQNRDGGFSDISRSSYPHSNALDTGWAAIALETIYPEGLPSQVNSPPHAALSHNPQIPTEGVNVQFNASASYDLDVDQLSYNWTFGDGNSASGVAPSHVYSVAGNYTVILTVFDSGTNPGPLSNTKSAIITVEPTSVQQASTLSLKNSGLFLAIGAIALVAIIASAFYLGRRTRQTPHHP